MAAPSGTKWGSIVGGYGRIGIYVSVTNVSNTQSKRHTEIWFWSKYSVRDSSNTFYYNDESSSATTSKGSVSISTSVDSGGGWSTSNQQKIYTADYTFNRGTSNSVKNVAVKLTGIDRVGGTMTCVHSYTIPKKPSYTVSYNANGGSGAPGSQTKWYGTNLTLSSTRPSRTGYSFQGWATSASGGVAYQPGASYSANAGVTLYAVWKANTYTVSYNANGGSGQPGNQTKTYGVNLTLSSTRPTRPNYNFLGWSTSPTGSVQYNPGSTYTSNSSVTLYAIWQLAYVKPRISGFTAQRCNSAGAASESGTYGKVTFNWATDRTVTKVYIQWKAQSSSTWSELSIGGTGISAIVSDKVFGSGALSTETSYIVRVYVSDSGGTTYSSEISLGTIKYPIDVKAGGTGVAFGKVAESANLFDVGWLARFRNGFKGDWISEPMAGGDAREIIHVPYLTYGDFGSSTETDNYFKEWLKWICKNYPGKTGAIFIGAVCPNSQGTAICYIYDTSNVSNGLPQYSGGFYIYLNGGGFYFGTSSYNYRYRYHDDIPWSSIQNKPSTFPPSSHSHTFGQISGNIVYFGNSMLEQDGANTFLINKSSGTLHFRTNNTYTCDFFLQPGSGAYYGFLLPNATNKITLGSTAYRWYGGYFGQACNTSSDARLKDNIIPLDSELSMFLSGDNTNIFEKFFFKLIPKAYSLKMENSTEHEGRMHIGMIAQDVEKALNECNLNEKNVAYLTHSFWTDEETGEPKDEYSLRYEEFIALNTHMIQKAHKKIEAQQKEINDLKSQVQELKDLVLNLSKNLVKE